MISSALILAFFIGSIFFAMVGLGGGVFYTPLQLAFGIPIHDAIPLSLLLIVISSFSASFIYRKAKKIDWKLAFLFSIQMMLAAFFGGVLAHIFDASTLTIIFAIIISFAAFMLLIKVAPKPDISDQTKKSFTWERTYGGQTYQVPIFKAFILSISAGLMSGLAGIGGGAITVPIMTLLLGIPIDIAIGTSSFMVGITALAGLAGHLMQIKLSIINLFFPALAVFVGAYIGARFSLRVNHAILRKMLSYILFALSLFIVSQELF